jgi:catechol 2,3-dioxygenase-like lactoylglutathione lyase family enzyme
MNYRFIEVSMASRDVKAQEEFWIRMFGARVIFRGQMASQPFTRLLACGITLIFREDPDLLLPPGPGEERQFRQHLGLRVDDLDKAIADLESRGAKFVMTPALVKQFQKAKQDSGRNYLETDFIAAPLTRERIASGEFRHDVAIFVGPDNLWIELNAIQEPADTQWYPPLESA